MRVRAQLLIAVLAPLLTGCATLSATLDGWEQGADGLSRPQRTLRDALSGGDLPVALAWKEDDALLRTLTVGVTTFYASQYARSAALLDTAALLTDERATTSVSRSGLALVTNDMVRPYQPRRTERLFIPYYGMLAYAQLGQWDDAAVEARRMAGLLARFAGDRDDDERALHASMHYLAAAVFERAGDHNAANVAYRNARALVDAYPEQPHARGATDGEVLVVVERGFVAFRTTETIHLALGQEDHDGLSRSADSRRHVVDQLRDRLGLVDAAPATLRQKSNADVVAISPVLDGTASTRSRHDRNEIDDDDVHHLSLSFPALRRSPHPWAGAPRVREDSTGGASLIADLQTVVSVDAASEVDERRERASLIARELARAAAHYAVTKAVPDKSGDVAGRLAEVGAAFLERADVRSWHLLPQELVMMRIRVPAGPHLLHLDVGDGANARQLNLGVVNVKPGVLTIIPARFWREPAPEIAPRCRRAAAPCVN
jgi:hypothetical protein